MKKLLHVLLTVLCAIALYAEPTQIITHANSQFSAIKGSLEYFVGDVYVNYLFKPKELAPYSGAYVTFESGARSNWHTHPAGQHLIVTSGLGWTQEWGKPKVEIKEGAVIWCPPGIKHWHGATAHTTMTHIAVTGLWGDKSVQWLEKVTDEQYNAQ